MRQFKTVALTLTICQIVSLAALAGGQEQALKTQYRAALGQAQAKDFERAYEMAFKIIRSDEFYYEAQVLRIALAAVLKKTGSEAPQNLIRVAKDYAPLGSNLEQDVQNLINQLSGTP